MKLYILAAAVSMAAIIGNAWLNKVQRLTAANQQLQEQVQQAQDKADGYQLLIQRLVSDLAAARESHAQLQRTQTELAQASTDRTALIRRLQRENQELKNWAAVELPAAVQCLRNRPAIRSADAYAAWLSSGDPLPAACH